MRYPVVVERGTRVAALQAGHVDAAYPGDTTPAIAEQLKTAVPRMVFVETTTNVSENLLINTKKPPFDNVKVRRGRLQLLPPPGGLARPLTQLGRGLDGPLRCLPHESIARAKRLLRDTPDCCCSVHHPTVQSCRGRNQMGRTNIVLDDRLVREGLRRFRCRSKRELVHLALTELLNRAQRRDLLALRGQVKWEGDLAELRRLRS